jgi:hypothetical protein
MIADGLAEPTLRVGCTPGAFTNKVGQCNIGLVVTSKSEALRVKLTRNLGLRINCIVWLTVKLG